MLILIIITVIVVVETIASMTVEFLHLQAL